MKNIIKRLLVGGIVGISVGYIISLIISVLIGKGDYYGASPMLIDRFGNELNAMIIQTFGSMLLGGVFSAASYAFENDYSLTKQTIIHFFVTMPVYLFISYMLGWLSFNSIKGVLMALGIYVVIYIVIWLIMYLYWKQKISKLNEDIKVVN